jgi:hypothetical protein
MDIKSILHLAAAAAAAAAPPGLFFPELAKLTAEFLPKVEAAYYIHNFKGTRPGGLHVLLGSLLGRWGTAELHHAAQCSQKYMLHHAMPCHSCKKHNPCSTHAAYYIHNFKGRPPGGSHFCWPVRACFPGYGDFTKILCGAFEGL